MTTWCTDCGQRSPDPETDSRLCTNCLARYHVEFERMTSTFNSFGIDTETERDYCPICGASGVEVCRTGMGDPIPNGHPQRP